MRPKTPIYLDYGATSFKKPPAVTRAMKSAIREIAANPGRSGYRQAHRADRFIYESRKMVAGFFGLKDASRLIFTPGCTWSLNMAIKGIAGPGSRVVMTGRQHNSVSRTLLNGDLGYRVETLPWDGKREFPFEKLEKLLTGNTAALAVNHASNVDGLLFPIKKIGMIAARKGVPMIVDAAQTAGVFDIDLRRDGITALCAPGHKGLMGPSGIGVLALGPEANVAPFVYGGTGSFSDEMEMPQAYPDRLEPGSLNLAGIAGLAAAVKEIKKITPAAIRKKKTELTQTAYRGLSRLKNVTVYRPAAQSRRAPLFSFNIKNADPAEVGELLDGRYNIACRVGLHCAPLAHKELGTFPEGTVRFSPGWYTTKTEISRFVKAVTEIAGRY